MSSDSESSEESGEDDRIVYEPPKKKKGVRNTHLYRHEAQKRHRLRGESYKSSSTGRNMEAKSNTERQCTCKMKCTEKYTPEEKQEILKSVYNGRPKNEQDTFLMGLIERSGAARRRSRNENPKKRDNIFTYFILHNSLKTQVCKQAFSILYAIKNKVIFRLTRLIVEGIQPVDQRGIHRNRGNSLPDTVILDIDQHIRSFPLKESHYSSKAVRYLDASLSVKILHELFCSKHPEHTTTVKYDFFRKYYNEHHGYRFGRPQVDVCSTCEELGAKINSTTLNDNAKRVAVAEKIVHKKRADKFFKKQKEILALCREREDVGALVFDYMQNLPLPKIPVQEMFYLRKLWLFVFCVHDLKTNNADFYTYPEGEAKRGPNEVCSLLWKSIQNIDPGIKELHVFSDACGGQNRNNTLVRFFLLLITLGRFQKIIQYFPVRGHSFLQCDRNFGTAKRLIRRKDRIYTPEEYDLMISTSKKRGFVVTTVTSDDILDFKNFWPEFYKKTCKSIDKSSMYTISKYRQIEYTSTSKGYVTTSEYIDGLVKHKFLLQKSGVRPAMPTTKAYNGKIPINYKKINDIRKIVTYIPDDKKEFYENVLTWPTTTSETQDDVET